MDELRIVSKIKEKPKLPEIYSGKENIQSGDFFNPTVYNCKLSNTLSGHHSDVLCVTVTDDKIISGSDDQTIKIWDLGTGELLNTLSGHNSGIYSIIVNKGKIISASSDRTVKIWDLNTGKLETTILGHTNHVYSVVSSENRFVTASLDKTIKIWDFETKKLLHTIKDTVSTWSLSLYDGKIFAGLSDGTIKIWELGSGRLLSSYQEHEDSITSISVKNERVASASKDKTIKVWTPELELLYTINVNNSPVWSVLNSDGKIISGSEDKMIRIWDINEGKLIDSLNTHGDWISGLATAGGKIISSSADGTLLIWSKVPMHNCNTIDLTIEITEKTPFDTEKELVSRNELMKSKYNNRLVSYDFINIGTAEIMAEEYLPEKNTLPVNCNVICDKILNNFGIPENFSSNISIDIESAENLYKKGRFHDLFIKFYLEEQDLNYQFFLIFNYRKFKLDSKITVVDPALIKKFSVKSDRLKIVMGKNSLNYQLCNDIPKHNCNSIDTTDTFRSPFEPVGKFEKRVKEKLINYSYINIGKIELDAENYSIGNQVFPLTAFITCEKIINLSDLKRTFKGKINIDRYRAKNMFDRSKAHNLYIKYYEEENQLFFELSIIFEGIKYFISPV